MKTIKTTVKSNLPFDAALIAYAVAGVFLLKYNQYNINPDGISYLDIASKYAAGDFKNAVNGYWGPFYSWILVPFLLSGLPPLLSTKLLSLVIGLLTINGIRLLSSMFDMAEGVSGIILFISVPMVLFFSMNVITPDLLFACILIYYLYVVFGEDYAAGWWKGALCGTLGAAAYLAKSYGLPFFMAHFVLFNSVHYIKNTTDKKKNVLASLLIGLAVFMIISGTWATIISSKYGRFTTGTSGRYNYALEGPESKGHPMQYLGLLKPPNETATSVWEDPSYLMVDQWSPFSSWANIAHQLRLIRHNLYAVFKALIYCSVLLPVIIAIGILIGAKQTRRPIHDNGVLFAMITMLVFTSGYTIVLVEPRYLWLDFILALVLGGHFFGMAFRNRFTGPIARSAALVLIGVSFVVVPIRDLPNNTYPGRTAHMIGEFLRSRGIEGKTASNGSWNTSLYIAYNSSARYYGVTLKGAGEERVRSELTENGIDYYFVWDECEKYGFLSRYSEVTGGKVPGLRVYSIKKN